MPFLKIFYITVICFFAVIGPSNSDRFGIFGGCGTPDNINQIIERKTEYGFKKDYAMVGFSWQKELKKIKEDVVLSMEVQGIQHFSFQKSQEITLAPLVRFENPFKGFRYPLIFSVGDGISFLAGAHPKLEDQREKVNRVLNYFLVDIAMAHTPSLESFFRWHHRCHLFKTMAPAGTGSNFFVVGLRKNF
jgi:hypothetical protein